MPSFRVILIEHGYSSIEVERQIITQAGGEFIDADKLPLAEALRLCEEAEGILFRRIPITAEMIRHFRRCKILLRYGVGTDNVDVQAATQAKIIVGHVPAYCIDEVSSHALALLLAGARRIVETHGKVESGAWDVHRNDPIFRIAGRTVGLVGLGNIGRAVARKLAGWDLKLLASDPFVEPARANELGVRLLDETRRAARQYGPRPGRGHGGPARGPRRGTTGGRGPGRIRRGALASRFTPALPSAPCADGSYGLVF
jgi:D-3-phosphoglycerate dehydrogenase